MYRHLLAWRAIDGVWTGINPLKLKISSYEYPRTYGQGLECNKAHIVVPWVGVPGWLSPIVLHSQPAKSTCSTSDILMKGCTWRKDKGRCKQAKWILKYRQVHSPLAVSSQLSRRDSWSNCNEERWQVEMQYPFRPHDGTVSWRAKLNATSPRLKISPAYHLLTKSWNSEPKIPGSFGGG